MQRSSQDILDIGSILYENSTSSLPITITEQSKAMFFEKISSQEIISTVDVSKN